MSVQVNKHAYIVRRMEFGIYVANQCALKYTLDYLRMKSFHCV